MGQSYTEWAEGHRQEGHEEGGRAMLLRLASQRFGARTARLLEEHVRSMGAEQLGLVGDAVVGCDTADELLAVAGNSRTEEAQTQ